MHLASRQGLPLNDDSRVHTFFDCSDPPDPRARPEVPVMLLALRKSSTHSAKWRKIAKRARRPRRVIEPTGHHQYPPGKSRPPSNLLLRFGMRHMLAVLSLQSFASGEVSSWTSKDVRNQTRYCGRGSSKRPTSQGYHRRLGKRTSKRGQQGFLVFRP